MPTRPTPLATGELYHIYNRSISDQPIFKSRHDYSQALSSLNYYRFTVPPVRYSYFKNLEKDQREYHLKALSLKDERLVDILCFAFMPNHFHLLLRQKQEEGITTFVRRFTNSYVHYFNVKNARRGPLFQGEFKSLRVSTTEQLLHLSRYIHLNPVVSFVIKEGDIKTYEWTSYPDYLAGESNIVECNTVLSNFKNKLNYESFVLDQVKYGKELERIKHLLLE